MFQIKKIIGAVLALAAIQTAQAGVIPTVDGFVPLQYTENLSIQDFLSGVGGWNQSYHLASGSEVQKLLSAYSIAPHDQALYTHNEYSFIVDVGGSKYGIPGTYFVNGNQGVIGRSLDSYVSVIISSGDNTTAYPNCPSFHECTSPIVTYAAQSYTYKDDRSGLFLVEGATVPEPASLSLVGLGLGALFLRRRKS